MVRVAVSDTRATKKPDGWALFLKTAATHGPTVSTATTSKRPALGRAYATQEDSTRSACSEGTKTYSANVLGGRRGFHRALRRPTSGVCAAGGSAGPAAGDYRHGNSPRSRPRSGALQPVGGLFR